MSRVDRHPMDLDPPQGSRKRGPQRALPLSLACASLALTCLPAEAAPSPPLQHSPNSGIIAAAPAPGIAPGWRAQVDIDTGRLRRAWGPGLPLDPKGHHGDTSSLNNAATLQALARSFLATYGQGLALPLGSLELKAVHRRNNRLWISIQQVHRGLTIEGATVELRLIDGRVVLFGGQTRPEARRYTRGPTLSVEDARRAALSLLQGARADSPTLIYLPQGPRELALVYKVEVTPLAQGPSEFLYIDAHRGGLVARRPGGHSLENTALMEREARSAGDVIVTQPFQFGTVIGDGIELETDAEGRFDLGDSPTFTLKMTGEFLTIIDGTLEDIPSTEITPGDATWLGTSPDLPALNTWAAFHEVHAWATGLVPELAYLAQPESAQVSVQGDSCNAYYQLGKGMFFFVGDEDEGCVGFARIADVVYHEFGHGLHHALLKTGIFDDSISEGSADYIAATLTGDPIVGPGAYGPGTYIREMDSNRRYPTDLIDSIHTDGLIWAGAMWDLRVSLKAAFGEEGVAIADRLFVTALMGGPGFQDVYSELLFADDDDADLSNGTPHQCHIDAALGPHGLSAGGLGLLSFGHTPLDDQPQAGPFEVSIRPEFDGRCDLGDTSTLALFYRVEGQPWRSVAMSEDPGDPGRFMGFIPDVPPGGEVQYDVQLWDAGYDKVASLSGGRPDLAPRFYVGETQALWCDDFEADKGWSVTVSGGEVGDWTRGQPLGLGGDPLGAYSGQLAMGTRFDDAHSSLSFPGHYRPGLRQSLISPPIDTQGSRQLRLRFMRSLSVEDGSFDEARVSAQGSVLWENIGTQGGSFHTLDSAWSRQTLRAWSLDGRSDAQFVFYLRSDDAIELGGWTIDDVCVDSPLDLDRRYRGQITKVSQNGEGEVIVEGVAPWALPLESITLYRRVGGPVGDPLQATALSSITAPKPGEALRLIDESPPKEGELYYRLISFDGRYRFPTDASKEGEDGILIIEPETPSPTPTPTLTPEDTDREEGGCGGGAAWCLILALPGALSHRRRA